MAGTSHVEEGCKGGPPPTPPPLSMTQSLSDSGGLTLLGVGDASALYTRKEITAWPPVPLRTSQASPDLWLSEEANQQRTWGLSQ